MLLLYPLRRPPKKLIRYYTYVGSQPSSLHHCCPDIVGVRHISGCVEYILPPNRYTPRDDMRCQHRNILPSVAILDPLRSLQSRTLNLRGWPVKKRKKFRTIKKSKFSMYIMSCTKIASQTVQYMYSTFWKCLAWKSENARHFVQCSCFLYLTKSGIKPKERKIYLQVCYKNGQIPLKVCRFV